MNGTKRWEGSLGPVWQNQLPSPASPTRGSEPPPQGGQRSMVPSQQQGSGWLSSTHPNLSWTLLPNSLFLLGLLAAHDGRSESTRDAASLEDLLLSLVA